MTKLSVNINKLATIRNARGGNNPDLVSWATKIQNYGAHGITVHPRPDERHIKTQDAYDLKKVVHTEFNIEGFPDNRLLKIISDLKPDQCTLVPDEPDAITSNKGWEVVKNFEFLKKFIDSAPSETRISIFVEPSTCGEQDAKAMKDLGVKRAELYTEAFALNPGCANTLDHYSNLARRLEENQIELNAGHDLSLKNLDILLAHLPQIKEVSIGHALVCEALELGMEKTIHSYLKILDNHK